MHGSVARQRLMLPLECGDCRRPKPLLKRRQTGEDLLRGLGDVTANAAASATMPGKMFGITHVWLHELELGLPRTLGSGCKEWAPWSDFHDEVQESF